MDVWIYICMFQNVSATTSIKRQNTGLGVNVAGPSVFVAVFTHASKELGRVTVLPVSLCCYITQFGLSHLPGPSIWSCALADKRKRFLSFYRNMNVHLPPLSVCCCQFTIQPAAKGIEMSHPLQFFYGYYIGIMSRAGWPTVGMWMALKKLYSWVEDGS
jgi:hypothetical protein